MRRALTWKLRWLGVRWLVELDCRTWLAGPPGLAHACWLTRTRCDRLVLATRKPREYRHDDQPAVRQLVVAGHGVTVVVRLTRSAESLEHVVRFDGAVKRSAGCVEFVSALRKDGHARVHYLHDVVWADGEAVVGRITHRGIALWANEIRAESSKACGDNCGAARPRGSLFDLGRSTGNYYDRRRNHRVRALFRGIRIGRESIGRQTGLSHLTGDSGADEGRPKRLRHVERYCAMNRHVAIRRGWM
jgi:hypothetical protein